MSKKTIITIAAILGALAVLFAVMFVVRVCNLKTIEKNQKELDELNGQYTEVYDDYIAAQDKLNSYLPAAEQGEENPAETAEESGETDPLIGGELEETKEAVDKELEKEQGTPAEEGAAE